jgi:hypothetical protein
MRVAFALLVALHGAVHAMGFVKAFKIAELATLHRSISRPEGLIWLAATVLFLAGAVLLLASAESWWMLVGLAVLVSQSLIVMSWTDAKFGTVPNVIILVPLVVAILGHGPGSLRAAFNRDAAVERLRPVEESLITDADVSHLPSSVQGYLRFAGAVGRPRVTGFRVSFRGAMRRDPHSSWMPSVAIQESTANPAGRLFLMDSTWLGLPFQAFHRYAEGHATMKVKAASMVTVVDAKGPEMDRSETVTFFNDMCLLAPSTLIDPAIHWEAADGETVKATFTNAGQTISAVLTFDAEGALLNFWSDDRYRSVDGVAYEKARWSTPVREYRNLNGRRVPAYAEASWTLPTGEFTYARFKLLNIEYK